MSKRNLDFLTADFRKKPKFEILTTAKADELSEEITNRVYEFQKSLKNLLEVTPDNFDVENGYVTDAKVDFALGLKRMYNQGRLQIADVEDFGKYRNDGETDKKNGEKWENRLPNVSGLSQLEELVNKAIGPVDLDSYPPPLPKVKDKELLQRVFMHRSLAHELNTPHYERLEFLGDSILNHAITKIIYTRLPEAQEGDMTKLRSRIVSNVTLSGWAKLYGFDSRIKVSYSARLSTNVTLNDKAVADTLEAYVAAVAHDRGMDVVENWLLILAEPFIIEYERAKQNTVVVDMDAKNKLYRLVSSRGLRPEYKAKGGNEYDGYIVAVEMNGEELGRAVGMSLKEAGHRAAMNALDNCTVIAKYRRLKISDISAESAL
ncbi:ribonuclease III domain-containing protein [Lipomyces japonicus]|uniref:ribonuclease III domain-containing protein n=1 Tax=Lipomyces japonicus TaxID=56871 RepID=UPI0034CFB244